MARIIFQWLAVGLSAHAADHALLARLASVQLTFCSPRLCPADFSKKRVRRIRRRAEFAQISDALDACSDNVTQAKIEWPLFLAGAAVGTVVGAAVGFLGGSRKEDTGLVQQQAVEEVQGMMYESMGLMSPEVAKKTKPVRLPGFLSGEEVAALLQQVNNAVERGVVGQERRRGQDAPIFSQKATYLQTDGVFKKEFKWLHDRVRTAMLEVDAANWQILKGRDPARLNFRTVECIEYQRGHGLTRKDHYDNGSLITFDIMLTNPGVDFEGGNLVLPNSPRGGEGERIEVPLQLGDAAVFVSHRCHNVTTLTKGRRIVLVLELWDGPERVCPHRCLTYGPCYFKM